MEKNNIQVMETVFDKCPVCKKGSVQFITKKVLFIFNQQDLVCNKCNARFKWEGDDDGEDSYSLDLSRSEQENKYDGQTLKKHEWQRGTTDFEYCVENDMLPTLKTDNLKIILQDNEKCHWGAVSELLEERAVRQTYGGAVRVMKGVYIGGSQGESHGQLRKIDKGILILTNQRLIFNGGLRNAEYRLDKIVSIEEYRDAVEIGASNKQKVQTFIVEKPHQAATFIRMAIKHLSKSKKNSIEVMTEFIEKSRHKRSPDEIEKSYKEKKNKLEALKGKPFSERLPKETAIKMTMSSEENEMHNKEMQEVSKLGNDADELIKDYRYKEAETKLKKAISIVEQGWLYCKLGDLYKKLEKYDDAMRSYKNAIKIEPDIPYPKRAIESLERMMNKSKKKK